MNPKLCDCGEVATTFYGRDRVCEGCKRASSVRANRTEAGPTRRKTYNVPQASTFRYRGGKAIKTRYYA